VTVCRKKTDKTAADQFDTKDRRNNPTFCGFLKEQMSPIKGSVQMQPAVIKSKQTIPGGVGWGVDQRKLIKDNKMLKEDH